jgi:hypothetical protein
MKTKFTGASGQRKVRMGQFTVWTKGVKATERKQEYVHFAEIYQRRSLDYCDPPIATALVDRLGGSIYDQNTIAPHL